MNSMYIVTFKTSFQHVLHRYTENNTAIVTVTVMALNLGEAISIAEHSLKGHVMTDCTLVKAEKA